VPVAVRTMIGITRWRSPQAWLQAWFGVDPRRVARSGSLACDHGDAVSTAIRRHRLMAAVCELL